MVNIDKIKLLAREKGIKIKFICSQLGLAETYLSNVKNGKDRMTDERLKIIADILDTTTAYLLDETDIKEKAPSPSVDGENAKYNELMSLLDQMDDKSLSRFIELVHLASLPDEDFDRAIAILRLAIPGEQS